MRGLKQQFTAFREDRNAVTALEYGIAAACLAFVLIFAFQTLSISLSGIFTQVSSGL
jgi:Flp pilus assembly pilin Flp